MPPKPQLTASEAVALIPSGSTIAVGGAGAGHALPDLLLKALGDRFRSTDAPTGLTLFHPFGVGNQKDRGLAARRSPRAPLGGRGRAPALPG